MKILYIMPLILSSYLSHSEIRADQLIEDDLVVQGSACLGFGCINGESFPNPPLVLKENNVRVFFEDPDMASTNGKGWQLEANSHYLAGESYFDFLVRSVDPLAGELVTGGRNGPFHIDYSSYCDAGVALYSFGFLGNTGQILTDGQVVLRPPLFAPPGSCVATGPGEEECPITCEPVPVAVKNSVLFFGLPQTGVYGGDGVAVGYNSEVVESAISVGSQALLRKLINVADGISTSHALTVGLMNGGASVLDDLQDDIEAANVQLNEVESVIEDFETGDADGIPAGSDNCLTDFNPDQSDADADGEGDICDNDDDNDTIADVVDFCPATSMPEETVPSRNLRSNRYVISDDSGEFQSTSSRGYSLADTGGCSCEQILTSSNDERYGCRASTLRRWIRDLPAHASGL